MAAMQCPICTGAMDEEVRSGLAVDVCTVCGSIWFDQGEFDAAAPVLKGTEERMARWRRPVGECVVCGEDAGDAAVHCDVPVHIPCPRCRGGLAKIRTRTIRMEHCESCQGFLLEPEMVERLATRVAEPDPPPPPPPEPDPPGLIESLRDLVSRTLGI